MPALYLQLGLYADSRGNSDSSKGDYALNSLAGAVWMSSTS
jgi:hypothetical protein